MKRILSSREQLILYLTLFVITFSLIFNFLLAPVFSKNDGLNKDTGAARRKLQKYMRLISQKDEIRAKYGKFFSLEPAPEKDGSLSALSELEAIAGRSNIHIKDIRPDNMRAQAGLKETIVNLRAEGQIEGLLKFIYEIEHSLSSLSINKLQLNAKPNLRALEGIFTISQYLNQD